MQTEFTANLWSSQRGYVNVTRDGLLLSTDAHLFAIEKRLRLYYAKSINFCP